MCHIPFSLAMNQLFNGVNLRLSLNRSFINYLAVICEFYSESATSTMVDGIIHISDRNKEIISLVRRTSVTSKSLDLHSHHLSNK